MDGVVEKLKEKLGRQLAEAAETAAALQAAERRGMGVSHVPHYSLIESAAHQVGRELSCRIQSRAAREIVAVGAEQAACPKCGAPGRVEVAPREVTSIDGKVALDEARTYCNRCRRSFFPSA